MTRGGEEPIDGAPIDARWKRDHNRGYCPAGIEPEIRIGGSNEATRWRNSRGRVNQPSANQLSPTRNIILRAGWRAAVDNRR